MKQYTTEQINQAVKGTLDGSPTIMITGVEQIAEATTNQLTFIETGKFYIFSSMCIVKSWPYRLISSMLRITQFKQAHNILWRRMLLR